ncbi:hypothetical protein A6U96_19100 [Agrobacterium tumefaciens]|nr:hypothetical protein A6U96_19100 [Agrobacterium tumefaciens]
MLLVNKTQNRSRTLSWDDPKSNAVKYINKIEQTSPLETYEAISKNFRKYNLHAYSTVDSESTDRVLAIVLRALASQAIPVGYWVMASTVISKVISDVQSSSFADHKGHRLSERWRQTFHL